MQTCPPFARTKEVEIHELTSPSEVQMPHLLQEEAEALLQILICQQQMGRNTKTIGVISSSPSEEPETTPSQQQLLSIYYHTTSFFHQPRNQFLPKEQSLQPDHAIFQLNTPVIYSTEKESLWSDRAIDSEHCTPRTYTTKNE